MASNRVKIAYASLQSYKNHSFYILPVRVFLMQSKDRQGVEDNRLPRNQQCFMKVIYHWHCIVGYLEKNNRKLPCFRSPLMLNWSLSDLPLPIFVRFGFIIIISRSLSVHSTLTYKICFGAIILSNVGTANCIRQHLIKYIDLWKEKLSETSTPIYIFSYINYYINN